MPQLPVVYVEFREVFKAIMSWMESAGGMVDGIVKLNTYLLAIRYRADTRVDDLHGIPCMQVAGWARQDFQDRTLENTMHEPRVADNSVKSRRG